MHCGQALRCAWAWLRASWLSAISGASRPSVCGSRTVGRPEFIRVVQFRPKGRNSLTTFREQTALRGCPRARGVRCRIAPCRSLCSPPTLPAGRFGLRPRPHWGHASLRDSSLRSPAGKKALIAHFDGGACNVARNGVGWRSPAFGARSCSPFSAVKMGGLFPSAAYRRSAPPQVARGGLNQCKLQCRGIAWMVLQSRRTGLFFFCGWRYPYANNVAWDTSIIGFLQRKRPAGFHIHAGLCCEP